MIPKQKKAERNIENPDPNKVNDAYKRMVMDAFDDFEHEDARSLKERRTEVERAARQKL